MKNTNQNRMIAALASGLALMTTTPRLRADTFGTGPNAFTIDFVTVGNPGNGNDAGAGGGIYSSPYGGVDYSFRMSVHEISATIAFSDAISVNGPVGSSDFGPDAPITWVSWYSAANFVNALNISAGHQAAYDITWTGSEYTMNLWSSEEAWQLGGENRYRHKDAYYFLPSEDEWYKAAYHKNDGITANYWDYPTASNTEPTPTVGGTAANTAVWNAVADPVAVDNAGGLSAYGTMAQGGNVWEWMESAADGSNNSTSENRILRGAASSSNVSGALSSIVRIGEDPSFSESLIGFRVASVAIVPEPSFGLLLLGGLGASLLNRRRR